jgi:hypothetical protein
MGAAFRGKQPQSLASTMSTLKRVWRPGIAHLVIFGWFGYASWRIFPVSLIVFPATTFSLTKLLCAPLHAQPWQQWHTRLLIRAASGYSSGRQASGDAVDMKPIRWLQPPRCLVSLVRALEGSKRTEPSRSFSGLKHGCFLGLEGNPCRQCPCRLARANFDVGRPRRQINPNFMAYFPFSPCWTWVQRISRDANALSQSQMQHARGKRQVLRFGSLLDVWCVLTKPLMMKLWKA